VIVELQKAVDKKKPTAFSHVNKLNFLSLILINKSRLFFGKAKQTRQKEVVDKFVNNFLIKRLFTPCG
jgi:hypothetical protein